MVPRLGQDQLDCYPQEEKAADQFQIGNVEEVDDEQGEDDAQDHRRDGAKDDAPAALPLGERATGKRDDQRIVAAQQDIDPNDLGEGDPEGVVGNGHRRLDASSLAAEGRIPGSRTLAPVFDSIQYLKYHRSKE